MKGFLKGCGFYLHPAWIRIGPSISEKVNIKKSSQSEQSLAFHFWYKVSEILIYFKLNNLI